MSDKSPTRVVRIPREVYEGAERLRKVYLKKPKDGSDPFALIAIAGISAFIGGLIGYAIANLEKQSLKAGSDDKNE